MKYFLNTLLFGCTILVFASCQRDFTIDDNTNNPPPPGNNDSIRLVKYLEIDSVPGSGPDTTGVATFEYDAQNRLVTVLSYNSTDPADNLANYEKYFYHYNGSDTLADRLIYQLRNVSGSDINTHVDTSYYTYNASGKLLSDSSNRNHTSSFGFTHYVTKRNFNYQSNFFTISVVDTDPSFADVSIDSVFLTINGGNITGVRFTNYTVPDYVQQYGHNSSYTYDTHPNPLYRMKALASTIQLFEFANGQQSMFQKNNVTSVSQTSLAGETVTETITYQYKPNGYPSSFNSVLFEDWSGTPDTRYYRGVFIYN